MATSESTKSIEFQRIEDYLDDQIGEAHDLDSLDDLLAKVQEQQTLLQSQLSDAQENLARVEKEATSHAVHLQEQAVTFQRKQAELDRRLQEITYSSTTDDAVRAFESRMVKLRRLELATNYLELVKVVDQLQNDAVSLQHQSPRAAIRSYARLRDLSYALSDAQSGAEGAASQLVLRTEAATKTTHDSLAEGLKKSFTGTLERMKWPQKEMNLLGDVLPTWSEQVSLLLELDEADLAMNIKYPEEGSALILVPLEIMAQPLAQRFRFHFYGDRPTNRLDKPEYFLSHIFDLLDRFSQFMSDELQPILTGRIDRSNRLEDIYPDAVSAFISSLLPMVVSKSLSLISQISSHPQLLSHFINQLMSFDNTLRDSWNYNPHPGSTSPWKGLTWLILDHHRYFEQWLKVEKDFALSRYRTIRDAPDSGDIDYEGVDPGFTKPTKGTIRVNDLLETITDRYRGLLSFSQKMKFVIGVQISIFDDYHAHLHGSLQAYLASSHTAGRLLQGQYSKHEAFDQRALGTLCKIYGSAEYLERKMSDWSDDIFFLELWDELQARVRTNTGSNGTIGKDLRIDEVAAKTSTSIKQSDGVSGYDPDSGALFDETALAYNRLRMSSESEILRLLDINVKEAIAPFARLEAWASMSSPAFDPGSLSPSSALDSFSLVTSVLLAFLSKVLSRPPLRKIVKHYCSTVQTECIGSVLLAHDFSAAGVSQFKRDIMAIEDAIDTASGMKGVANSAIRKLNQAIELLGLPIKRSLNRSESGQDNEDEDAWGFDDADQAQGSMPNGANDSIAASKDGWSLWQAEKEVFRSNEAARQALADMGFDLISEQEARNLLKRRVELNS